jgi:hypothetical protein
MRGGAMKFIPAKLLFFDVVQQWENENESNGEK